jgi:hypothetical protein
VNRHLSLNADSVGLLWLNENSQQKSGKLSRERTMFWWTGDTGKPPFFKTEAWQDVILRALHKESPKTEAKE